MPTRMFCYGAQRTTFAGTGLTTLEQELERWARWRVGGPRVLGYPRSVIGRMIDGMPSNKCVACNGVGRVPGTQQGAAMQYVKCAVCKGARTVDLTPSTHSVNPAFIHATSSYCGDPKSERMDWAICQLTIPRAKQVLVIEYCERGTQAAKARVLGITQGRYSQVLTGALEALDSIHSSALSTNFD